MEPDGSVLATQRIRLVPDPPVAFDPVARGQCWGIDLSMEDWSVSHGRPLLSWTTAAADRSAELTTACLHASGWLCADESAHVTASGLRGSRA